MQNDKLADQSMEFAVSIITFRKRAVRHITLMPSWEEIELMMYDKGLDIFI